MEHIFMGRLGLNLFRESSKRGVGRVEAFKRQTQSKVFRDWRKRHGRGREPERPSKALLLPRTE